MEKKTAKRVDAANLRAPRNFIPRVIQVVLRKRGRTKEQEGEEVGVVVLAMGMWFDIALRRNNLVIQRGASLLKNLSGVWRREGTNVVSVRWRCLASL